MQKDIEVKDEVQRLGSLAHEMRNALNNAATAHQFIKEGLVETDGSTSEVLEDAFTRMKDIINRSMSEVRMRGESVLAEIVLHICITPDLLIEADRHLVFSALSNLVQNAIKFNRFGGNVWIRSRLLHGRVIIDVEDECGGLPKGKPETLFQPFTQRGKDKSGLGFGLSIARRAIALNDGEVTVRDIPDIGCIFSINIPQAPLQMEDTEWLSDPSSLQKVEGPGMDVRG